MFVREILGLLVVQIELEIGNGNLVCVLENGDPSVRIRQTKTSDLARILTVLTREIWECQFQLHDGQIVVCDAHHAELLGSSVGEGQTAVVHHRQEDEQLLQLVTINEQISQEQTLNNPEHHPPCATP